MVCTSAGRPSHERVRLIGPQAEPDAVIRDPAWLPSPAPLHAHHDPARRHQADLQLPLALAGLARAQLRQP